MRYDPDIEFEKSFPKESFLSTSAEMGSDGKLSFILECFTSIGTNLFV